MVKGPAPRPCWTRVRNPPRQNNFVSIPLQWCAIYYAFVTNRPSLHRSLDDLEKHVTHMNFHFFIWTYLYANTCAFCKPPTNNGDFSVSDGPCPTNASFSGHTPDAQTLGLIAAGWCQDSKSLPRTSFPLQCIFWRSRAMWFGVSDEHHWQKKCAICWDMYQELCFIQVVRTSLCLWNDS